MPLIPTYWYQEEALSYSEFAEPDSLVNRYVCIVAYFGTMLEVSWHIPEGN